MNTARETSYSSARSSGHSTECTPMGAVIRTALARRGLDAPQADLAQPSAFFRGSPAPASFSVPPSEEYLKEHSCWKDVKALAHPSSSARALAAMQDPAQYGLGRMPPFEPTIASLILAPDRALRPDARCPRPQCRVTDDLLLKAYDAAARMGRIGNSLSHLMLALSTSLQQAAVEPSMQDISDASLQAFALMSRELGRVMSTLVQTRHQVWLAQSPLTEACRRALRAVPVTRGELFGSAAQETLERAAHARQTNLQLSGLRRSVSAPGRPRDSAAPQSRSQPRSYPARGDGLCRSRRPTQPPEGNFRAPARPSPGQPRAAEPHGRRLFFPAAAQSLGCLYYRPLGGFQAHSRPKGPQHVF